MLSRHLILKIELVKISMIDLLRNVPHWTIWAKGVNEGNEPAGWYLAADTIETVVLPTHLQIITTTGSTHANVNVLILSNFTGNTTLSTEWFPLQIQI